MKKKKEKAEQAEKANVLVITEKVSPIMDFKKASAGIDVNFDFVPCNAIAWSETGRYSHIPKEEAMKGEEICVSGEKTGFYIQRKENLDHAIEKIKKMMAEKDYKLVINAMDMDVSCCMLFGYVAGACELNADNVKSVPLVSPDGVPFKDRLEKVIEKIKED